MALPLEGGFAGVSTDFPVIPTGVYNAEVTNTEVKVAKEGAKYEGKEYISWEFSITDEGYDNRKVWVNTSLVNEEKPRRMLKRTLLAFHTEEELDAEGFELDPESYIGRECRVKVNIQDRDEGKVNNVRAVLPASDGSEGGSLPT